MQNLKRYVPLAVWLVVVFTIIVIPLKIIGLGFIPNDDAMRHSAKAVSGKSWPEILVMRGDFAIDPSPGWQAILAEIHQVTGCGVESLVVFSVVSLMLLVNLIGLPEPGGILYDADMVIFFQTFYKNPTAPWKYALGFEPGLMTQENLDVLRKVQWNYSDMRAYEPWVKKMRPEDRLVIRAFQSAVMPNIPELEWNYAATGLWVGRLPRAANPILIPSKP